MEDARALFRNPDITEFVIVTIPTIMAVAESARLAEALRSESVPVSTILINQVQYPIVANSMHCTYFKLHRHPYKVTLLMVRCL